MFRKLKATEVECRVSQVTAKGCSLLLYKNARVDRSILDETVGPMNWQNDFKIIDGKMYGSISIWDKDKEQWITKFDCGTESNTESEKGQASDAFKRAGFKWGIGVELYTAPFIWASVPTKNIGTEDNEKWVLVNRYQKFLVDNIEYNDKGEISYLLITDEKGNKIFSGRKQCPSSSKK